MASRPSALSRTSTTRSPAVPVHSTPSTLISASASLTGIHPITLGENAILQPRSRVLSTSSPVDIGEGCIIAERACVGIAIGTANPRIDQQVAERGVKFGRGVLIESGALIEAAAIGAFTIIEAGAKVGKGAIVGERSRICAKVEVGEGAMVPSRTVVYGNAFGESRVEKEGGILDERREGWIREHGKALRKVWTGK